MLVDIMKEVCPEVKKVTTVQTVCDAMNTNETHKSVLSEVHKLLRAVFDHTDNIIYS